MGWGDELAVVWRYAVYALTALISALAAGHAILYKRDTRATALWVGFICLTPLIGAVLYFILGVNRLKRRATSLRAPRERPRHSQSGVCSIDLLPEECRDLSALTAATEQVLTRRLLPGNSITPLINGDEAYPAMLRAIDDAKVSVTLSTYIFDRDDAGLLFVEALRKALDRGVEIRVLIDATGSRYSWPSILWALRRAEIRYARFLPTLPLWQLLSLNLRNHRKILVIDGALGFTGGMNIRVGNWLSKNPSHPVRDLHFKVEGPVVAHLQEVFAADWFFTAREELRGDKWFPPLEPRGNLLARGIAVGPDEDFEKLRWTLLAALTAAKRSIRIATPYFLPEPTLIAALNLAALRGVAVHILLPAKNNLPIVHWASTAHWWQLLQRGCRIWLSPPPFDHSKVFVVDEAWSLIGSANWDPRSIRLNFEFNVECYNVGLARTLAAWFDTELQRSHETSLAEVDARSLPIRLRDGVARLLTPYL